MCRIPRSDLWVPSYRGKVIVGDQILTGIPATGVPEFLYRRGYVIRRPLAEITTAELARIAWQRGLISYESMVLVK